MVAEWLKDYLYGAVIGVMFIFLAGAIATTSSGNGITGYAVADYDTVEMTGNTKDFKVITFACELSPDEIHVEQGDFVTLYFTSYDLTNTKYLFELPGYDIYMDAKGQEVSYVKFYADKRGIFKYFVKIPCENYGFKTEGKLYVH